MSVWQIMCVHTKIRRMCVLSARGGSTGSSFTTWGVPSRCSCPLLFWGGVVVVDAVADVVLVLFS